MNDKLESGSLTNLIRLLDQLRLLHENLGRLIEQKIQAMQKADNHAMQIADSQELETARNINEREGLRRRMMDGIGEQLGLSASHARALSLSQLAERLIPAQRKVVEQAAIALRQSVGKVARLNQIASTISRNILMHLDAVFSSVVQQGSDAQDYSFAGQAKSRSETLLFDTVG